MKVNKEKIKEEILKGEYARLEILVPNAEKNAIRVTPCIELDVNANAVTLMLLCKVLDEVKKEIVEKNPEVKLAEILAGFKSNGKIYEEEISYE